MRLYSTLVLIAAAATDALPLAGYKTTYEVVKLGTGSEVVSKGATVTVHATGIVAETSKKFWSTKDAGQQPFTYQAGVGGVITGASPAADATTASHAQGLPPRSGWDQGCLGMKLNEVRKLNIPAEEGGHAALAYPARPTAFWP